MPRLPRETKLRYIWIHVEPSKVTAFAELNTGTAMRPSREHLRTVLRTVADGCAASGEHNPQTLRMKREPLLRIREKNQKGPNKNSPVLTSSPPAR